jgi:type IV pilus assembly protein PilA
MPTPYNAPVNQEPFQGGYHPSSYGPTANGTVYSEGATYGSPNAYYSPYAAAPAKLKQGLAITSLVFGCVGLAICFIGLIGAIPGLICGLVAVKKANQKPMEYGGKGMAIAGIVTNGLTLLFIPVVMAIAIPNLMAARKAANEASTIQQLRTLSSAEAIYQSTRGRGSHYATLEELKGEGLIKADSAVSYGYKFKVLVTNCPVTTGIAGSRCQPRFVILATPVSYGSTGTGTRSFYLDETGVIRAVDRVGMDADSSAPALSYEY